MQATHVVLAKNQEENPIYQEYFLNICNSRGFK